MGQGKARLAQRLLGPRRVPDPVAQPQRTTQFGLQERCASPHPDHHHQFLAHAARQEHQATAPQALLPILRQPCRVAGQRHCRLFHRALQLRQAFPRGAFPQPLLQQVVEQFGTQAQLPLLFRVQALQFDSQHAHQVVQQAVVQQFPAMSEYFAGGL
ncbi:hypothetical protein D9M68_463970 [compost metagenome]